MFYCTGLISSSTLLIGYYHIILLRDINADMLLDKMCTNGFITPHDRELILAGHSIHQQKLLLLEHVRHMEMQKLVKFCEFVKETSLRAGLQLKAGIIFLYS